MPGVLLEFVQLWLLGAPATQYLPPLRTLSLDAILQSRGLSTTLRHQAT